MKVGKHTIHISHADKVLFPDDGITKGDLIDYYARIAAVMLPYLKDRPVTMRRFPEGIHQEGFYQQDISDYYPDWVGRASMAKREGGRITHVVCNDKASLVYIANQACITPHVWLSRQDKPEQPDMMVFDLDPPDGDFARVRRAAGWLKELLAELEIAPFIKTTGSRGVHVVVPLDRSADFDQVRKLSRGIARVLAERYPEQLTDEQRKNKRKGRVFIDTLRNSYGQTAVAPYAVRARPGAPVATPIDWSQLDDEGFDSQSYNISNIFDRISQRRDPWQDIWRRAYPAAEIKQRLNKEPPEKK